MLPPPFVLSTEKGQNRSLIQDVTPLLTSSFSTQIHSRHTEPHTIHTIPLVR